MKGMKRFLAILLALILCVGMIPAGAFASDAEEGDATTASVETPAETSEDAPKDTSEDAPVASSDTPKDASKDAPAETFSVTVNYSVPSGYHAPDSQKKTGKAGESYSFASPSIDGLTPDRKTVSGTIGSKDEVITVKYTVVAVADTTPDTADSADAPDTSDVTEKDSDSVDAPADDADDDAADTTTDDVADDSADTPADDADADSADAPADDAADDSADTPADDVTDDSADTPADDVTDDSADVPADDAANDSADTPADDADAADAPSGDAADDSAEDKDETPVEDEGDTPTEAHDETPAEDEDETPVEDETPTETQDETPVETQDETPAETEDDAIIEEPAGLMLQTFSAPMRSAPILLAAAPAKVTLTIVYQMPEGCETPAPAAKTVTGEPGEAYIVSSPAVSGFVPDQEAVLGTLGKEDATVTVTYSPVYYVVTVVYIVPAGYTAPKSVHKTGSPGTEYSFKTPTLANLTPDKDKVEGEIGSKDETIEVTYYADEYTVTAHYIVPQGFTAPPDGKAVGVPKAGYEIPSPTIKGLTPDKDKVTGSFGTADETINVTYTAESHTVTVNYVVPNGYDKPESKSETKPIGQHFSIPSPQIEGLAPNISEVSGEMDFEDHTVTVEYTDQKYTVVVQYSVPAGYEDKLPKQQSKTGLKTEEFEIPSPTIPGLTPDRSEVSGKIGDYSFVDGVAVVPVAYRETTYTVTVYYKVPEGYTAIPDRKSESGKKPGETYSIPSPEVKGCRPLNEDEEVVKGTIEDHDVVVTVEYTELQHFIFVYYDVPEGYTRPASRMVWGLRGTEYSIPSPTITGLKLEDPDQAVIEGEYGLESLDVTVKYVVDPDGACPAGGKHSLEIVERNEKYTEYNWYAKYIGTLHCTKCGQDIVVDIVESHCESDHNDDIYYGQYTDYGDYCVSPVCRYPGCEGHDIVGHAWSSGRANVIAGQTISLYFYYKLNADDAKGSWTYNVPSSGIADDGQSFSAGDTISVCTYCGHVFRVISHATVPHTVTVNYVVPEGNYSRKSWTVEQTQASGSTYEFRTPHIYGLVPDQDKINYTFTDHDETLTVTYYPVGGYNVTVNYVVPEGFTAPEAKELVSLMAGDTYSVPSPLLAGLKPDRDTVSAKVADKMSQGKNIVETVTYTPSRRVTVHYTFPAGYTGAQAQDVVYYYQTGETYNITPPSYNSVAPWPDKVSGTMGSTDVEATVEYYYNNAMTVQHKVTVNYTVPEGFTAPPGKTEFYAEGAKYEIPSPDVKDLAPSIRTVTGNMGRSDITVNVSYFKTSHTLTINYNVPEGYQKPESFTTQVKEGDPYARRSPTIDGLEARPFTVHGDMGKEDITVEVTYSPLPAMLSPYTLTVTYTVPEAFISMKPKTYTGRYSQGQEYNVPSPAIDGLVPSMDPVKGNMPGENLELEVVYRPEDDAYYYFTVHYAVPEGFDKPEDREVTGVPGTPFKIYSPPLADLLPEYNYVEGKIANEDQEVTVTYKRAYSIWITYELPSWSDASTPSMYFKVVPEGYKYSVPSPEITGFAPKDPAHDVVEGTITNADVRVTVEYERAPVLTVIYDYEGIHSVSQGDGTIKAPDPVVKSFRYGAPYSVRSPELERLVPDIEEVKGDALMDNLKVLVTYSDPTHMLRVHHTYPEDYKDAYGHHPDDSTIEIPVAEGAHYEYEPEKIYGLTANPEKVEGDMGTEDIEATVNYEGIYHTVSVKYVYPEDYTGAKQQDYDEQVIEGQRFTVPVEKIEGLVSDPKSSLVNIEMGKEDLSYTITYSWWRPTVTVYSILDDGTIFGSTIEEQHAPGESYHIPVQKYDHMKPDRDYVDGVMGEEDCEEEVVYSWIPVNISVSFVFPANYTGPKPENYTLQKNPGEDLWRSRSCMSLFAAALRMRVASITSGSLATRFASSDGSLR